MKSIKRLSALAVFAVTALFSINSSAHTVSLSWDVLGNGDVTFYNQHWHGAAGVAGSLFVDGVEHNFTGVLDGVSSISNLEGALINPSFATFAAGTLTALQSPNFLTVTISGITAGAHTFATTNIAHTYWNIPGTNGSINVVIPSVSEPSVLAIFGLGLAGLGLMRRRRTQA